MQHQQTNILRYCTIFTVTSYFCTVKHFICILRYTILSVFLLSANALSAQQQHDTTQNADSIEVSLLTCRPRQNVYSLYGHTAIRYTNYTRGIDVAVNYGMFSFAKPFFVLRFVFGLTDYEMGVEPIDAFMATYSSYGCGVWQQTLNLTQDEKEALAKALAANYELQNRVYRYNYFYDNCTTRARDIITGNIAGKVAYTTRHDNGPSFREITHQYNTQHPWARFGNDLLLGVKADMPTAVTEQQFLPDNLKNDFSRATITGKNGQKRQLVSAERWLVQPTAQVVEKEFPLSPSTCAIIFALIVIAATVFEATRNKNYWGIDCIVMLADGLCGMILLAMVFSEHPTVSINLQILLLNPCTLLFLPHTIKCLRHRRRGLWLPVWTVCMVLFLIGGIFQTYAEGMYIVALSLLLRYLFKIKQSAKAHE